MQPATDDAPPTVLYVKWTARSTLPALTLARPALVYHYAAPVCPAAPLALGAPLKLLALPDPRFHTPAERLPPASARRCYDTYDPHIEGPLVAARAAPADPAALVLVLRNTCPWNPVAYAHVTVPDLPGLTVHPDLRELARAPAPAHPRTPDEAEAALARVQLEEGVTILSRGPPERARAPESPYFEYEEPDDLVSSMKRSVGLGSRAGPRGRARADSR